jgi:hypothetical protein
MDFVHEVVEVAVQVAPVDTRKWRAAATVRLDNNPDTKAHVVTLTGIGQGPDAVVASTGAAEACIAALERFELKPKDGAVLFHVVLEGDGPWRREVERLVVAELRRSNKHSDMQYARST